MIREALVEYCAPTLAGIKTGSICTIQNGSKDIDDEIRELNGCLVKKGLSLIPIKKTAKTTIVYLYRPDRLKLDLQTPEAQKILEEKGYPCRNAGANIVTDSVTANNAPDDAALDACRSLGRALA